MPLTAASTEPAERWIDRVSNWLGRPKPEAASKNIDDLSIALGSSVNLRPDNQDRVAVFRFVSPHRASSFVLLALADGIGGMKEGGRCADLAIATLLWYLIGDSTGMSRPRLANALQLTNDAVYQRFRERGGTTLSLIFIPKSAAPVAVNIGDSRLYSCGVHGSFRQISVDDNVENQLRLMNPANSKIPQGLAQYGRQLTQFIGMQGVIDPRSFFDRLDGGTAYLLTSDGLHGQGDSMVSQIIANAPSPLDVVKRLTFLARWTGAKDNSSAVFIKSLEDAVQAIPLRKDHSAELWDADGKLEILWETSLRSQQRKGRDRHGDKHAGPKASQKEKVASDADEKSSEAVEVSFEVGDQRPTDNAN